jgi:hypothetical protein
MNPSVQEEVVAFLRGWLPESAKQTYRELIAEDPQNWSTHPHFREGVIARHVLRGNGFTEKVLGVASLDPYWPDLLARAVAEDGATSPTGSSPQQGE